MAHEAAVSSFSLKLVLCLVSFYCYYRALCLRSIIIFLYFILVNGAIT